MSSPARGGWGAVYGVPAALPSTASFPKFLGESSYSFKSFEANIRSTYQPYPAMIALLDDKFAPTLSAVLYDHLSPSGTRSLFSPVVDDLNDSLFLAVASGSTRPCVSLCDYKRPTKPQSKGNSTTFLKSATSGFSGKADRMHAMMYTRCSGNLHSTLRSLALTAANKCVRSDVLNSPTFDGVAFLNVLRSKYGPKRDAAQLNSFLKLFSSAKVTEGKGLEQFRKNILDVCDAHQECDVSGFQLLAVLLLARLPNECSYLRGKLLAQEQLHKLNDIDYILDELAAQDRVSSLVPTKSQPCQPPTALTTTTTQPPPKQSKPNPKPLPPSNRPSHPAPHGTIIYGAEPETAWFYDVKSKSRSGQPRWRPHCTDCKKPTHHLKTCFNRAKCGTAHFSHGTAHFSNLPRGPHVAPAIPNHPQSPLPNPTHTFPNFPHPQYSHSPQHSNPPLIPQNPNFSTPPGLPIVPPLQNPAPGMSSQIPNPASGKSSAFPNLPTPPHPYPDPPPFPDPNPSITPQVPLAPAPNTPIHSSSSLNSPHRCVPTHTSHGISSYPLALHTQGDQTKAIIDSGATHHFFHSLPLFTNYQPFQSPFHIVLGDGNHTKGLGVGNVGFLRNVMYAPRLQSNLMSVSALIASGSRIHFQPRGAAIHHADSIITATLQGSLCEVSVQSLISPAPFPHPNPKPHPNPDPNPNPSLSHALNTSTSPNLADIWHQRLGHPNKQTLQRLNKTYNLHIPPLHFRRMSFCSSCAASKAKSLPRPTHSSSRATRPFQYIHTDLCGPITPSSADGYKHFMVIVDDYSRCVFTYPLKLKSDAYAAFQKFLADLSLYDATPTSLNVLRSDNAGEFLSDQFQSLLKLERITHHKTIAGKSTQNGIAERAIATICSRLRSVLHYSSVPHRYWPHALAHATHLHNLLPTSGTVTPSRPDPASPYQLVHTRTPPQLQTLRTFGCSCWVPLDANRSSLSDLRSKLKLSSHGIECMYLGHPLHQKGIIVMSCQSQKMYTVADAVFNEARFPARPEPDPVFTSSSDRLEILSHPQNSPHHPHPAGVPAQAHPLDSLPPPPTTPSLPPAPRIHEVPAPDPDLAPIVDPDPAPAPPFPRRSSRAPQPREFFGMIHSAVAIDSDFRPTTLALAAAGMSANSLGPDCTPPSYKAALSCPDASLWLDAIEREKASMSKFAVFEEVPVPAHRQPITARWVFKIKYNPDGSVNKYKARLVARGFRQKAGIDYFETFAPVTRYETVRALLAFAAQHGLTVHQLDTCTAFLHGHLPEEVYLHTLPAWIQRQAWPLFPTSKIHTWPRPVSSLLCSDPAQSLAQCGILPIQS